MADETGTPARQLLVFEFPPGSRYEGQLVGALERIESGGTLRILDAVFAGRDPETGETIAVALSGGTAGMVSRLITFRLEPQDRAKTTRQALEGPSGEVIGTLTADLEPGAAVLAVLIEHAWQKVLNSAIERAQGTTVSSDLTEHERIADAWPSRA
jgi:hypothetical protein